MKDRSKASPRSTVITRNDDQSLSKSYIWVERGNFYGEVKGRKSKSKLSSDRFLIIGFDTEYKTRSDAFDRDELAEGLGRNAILSYQVYCKLYDPSQPGAQEWGGVCFPEDGSVDKRLSLADVVTFAIWKGISTGAVSIVPTRIYLVGHFTRADIPAFKDFQSLTQMMSSVRNTFLSIDGYIAVDFEFPDGDEISLQLLLRDTMLLTPAASKSLRALGELVGQEKIQLDPDPAKDQWYKANMDVLLQDDPKLFDRYALNDAVICVRYADRLIEQCRALLGVAKLPATLTSIGVDLLLQSWKYDLDVDPNAVLGKEQVSERSFNKKAGYFKDVARDVELREVAWHSPFATECYHGGRNEQFWFGPAFEDDWTDYDLSSAYPTAMAMIRLPDWCNIRVSTQVDDFTPDTLGVACVEFEFPESVRFPTLPVRTDNGLVFPRQGISDCASPEIALARSLGATLKIRHGVIVPYLSDLPVFGEFIKDCIQKRKSFGKGTLENLFWKELTNSSYGKTAQGLREKRVYDLRDRATKPLPESKITNPFFASYITSLVRSVLGEIMNRLPDDVCVFSCTTDGFLSSATDEDIAAAQQGPLVSLYRQSRQLLTGEADVIEIKHRIRKPLGWRTRGQATLLQGQGDPNDASNVVLAKGGIFLPETLEDVWQQNAYIVSLFLNRTPDHVIPMKIKTGIRDIVNFDADLVDKSLVKRLSMEFDWKRKPVAVRQVASPDHVAFSTRPWDTVDEFMMMRDYWEAFNKQSPFCLKTLDGYRQFASYVMTHSSLGKANSLYLRKKQGDVKRLRQSLGSAWRASKAGLAWQQDGISNADFAAILEDAGIPCSRADVENDSRKPFEPKKCPPTPTVFEALAMLSKRFPALELDAFVVNSENKIDLLAAVDADCPFLARA